MSSMTKKLKTQKSEASILVRGIKERAKASLGGTSHQVHGHVQKLKSQLSSTGKAGRKALAETLATTLPQDLKQGIKKRWSHRFSKSHGTRAGADQGRLRVPQTIVHALQRFKTKKRGGAPSPLRPPGAAGDVTTVGARLRSIKMRFGQKRPLVTESKSRPKLKAAADGKRGEVILT